jgi:chromosome segregation ATPase
VFGPPKDTTYAKHEGTLSDVVVRLKQENKDYANKIMLLEERLRSKDALLVERQRSIENQQENLRILGGQLDHVWQTVAEHKEEIKKLSEPMMVKNNVIEMPKQPESWFRTLVKKVAN